MRRWVEFVRHRPSTPIPAYCQRPYDSLAAMTLMHPQHFQFRRGSIRLEEGADPLHTTARFVDHADGPHRLVTGIDRAKAMRIHNERLLACSTRK